MIFCNFNVPLVEKPTREGKFRPNYERFCMVCSGSPVVEIVTGTENVDTGLCGVCCFGEADCFDPENW